MVKKELELKKIKKKWFTLHSPEMFGAKELSEIAAFEPDQLVGRHVELWLKELAGTRDTSTIAVLKIEKVQGARADTKIIGLYTTESYIQRIAKRFKERIMFIFTTPAKDIKLKFKLYYLCARKIPASLRAKILKLSQEIIADAVKEKSTDEVFNPDFQRKLIDSVRKDVRKVYPIDQIVFWKVKIEK